MKPALGIPWLFLVGLSGGVSQPLAGTFDPRPIINLVVMLTIIGAFIWALAVTFHSNDEKKVRMASDISKTLLGFLIGSAKSYLEL